MALRTALFDKFKSRDVTLLPLALFAALGVFYLLHKILSLQGDESYVFRMIWIAGKIVVGRRKSVRTRVFGAISSVRFGAFESLELSALLVSDRGAIEPSAIAGGGRSLESN